MSMFAYSGPALSQQIVVIVPSSAERYLSSWLFADINLETDSIDDLITAS